MNDDEINGNPTMHWYVIHTKSRQEQRALLNLEQQGFECYLPVLIAEKKLRQGVLSVIEGRAALCALPIHPKNRS